MRNNHKSNKNNDEIEKLNKFYLEKCYPDLQAIIQNSYRSIDEVSDNCVFVLDTNALLVPYTVSKDSLNEIQAILFSLKAQERLYVPARAVREFVKNRTEKLADIYKYVSQKIGVIGNQKSILSLNSYPILKNNKEYKNINKALEEAKKHIVNAVHHLKEMQAELKKSHFNDPVTIMYRDILTEETLIEMAESQDIIDNEFEYRIKHNVPPGFKDENKPDRGIGDFIIWQTIKEIGKKFGRNVVFVSDEKKSDWVHKQDNEALYPRFELIEEFRQFTGHLNFNIINYSEFLDLQKAKREVINEVEKYGQEQKIRQELEKHKQVKEKIKSQIFGVNIGLSDAGQDVGMYMSDGTPEGLVRARSREFREFVIREGMLKEALKNTNNEIKALKKMLGDDNEDLEADFFM